VLDCQVKQATDIFVGVIGLSGHYGVRAACFYS
jgi:hypothetical protein